VQLSGETILKADATIGFLHTGIEKTAEQKKWQQVIPLVERMDYLGAQSNSLAFCLSVERLLGVEKAMPQRVKDIRLLLVETQRIASHLVSLGTHALEVGAVSVLMYMLTDRERLLNLNEMLAGFRMFPSYIRVGGLREDLPPNFHEAVTAFLACLELIRLGVVRAFQARAFAEIHASRTDVVFTSDQIRDTYSE